MTLDLTEEETAALVRHPRQAVDYASYPLAPRLDPLKSILAELDTLKPKPEPFAAAASRHGAERRARSTKVAKME